MCQVARYFAALANLLDFLNTPSIWPTALSQALTDDYRNKDLSNKYLWYGLLFLDRSDGDGFHVEWLRGLAQGVGVQRLLKARQRNLYKKNQIVKLTIEGC